MSISKYTSILLKVNIKIFVLLLLYILLSSLAAHVMLVSKSLTKATKILRKIITLKLLT